MYTINNLAEELNKSEGDIIQNLIDYKYLKQDKSPSQITINRHIMNKNGLITREGYITILIDIILRSYIKEESATQKYFKAAKIGAHKILRKMSNMGSFDKILSDTVLSYINDVCECIPIFLRKKHTQTFIVKAFENPFMKYKNTKIPKSSKIYIFPCCKECIEDSTFDFLSEKELKNELKNLGT